MAPTKKINEKVTASIGATKKRAIIQVLSVVWTKKGPEKWSGATKKGDYFSLKTQSQEFLIQSLGYL